MTIHSAFSFASVQFSALLRNSFDTTQPVPDPVTDERRTAAAKDSRALATGASGGESSQAESSREPADAAPAKTAPATLDAAQQQNLVQFQRASLSYASQASYLTEQGSVTYSQSFQLSFESFSYSIQSVSPTEASVQQPVSQLTSQPALEAISALPDAPVAAPVAESVETQSVVESDSLQSSVVASVAPAVATAVPTQHPESTPSAGLSTAPDTAPQPSLVNSQPETTISAREPAEEVEDDSQHDADSSDRPAAVTRLSSENFQRLKVQNRERSVASSFSLELFTNEGDRVTLDFNQLDLLSRSRLRGTTQDGDRVRFAELERSSERNLTVSIQGDISGEEQSAIDDLLEGIFKVADKFFRGNLRSAVERLGDLEFDSSQLNNFALDMSLENRQQVNRAFLGQGGEVERFVSRDKGMAQMLQVLRDDQRQLIDAARTRFDEKSAVKLVQDVFLPLVLQEGSGATA